MALLAMCAYCTEDNEKLKYLIQTLESLIYTTDMFKHRLIIINNSQFKEAKEVLDTYACPNITVLHQKENLGTAGGINLALRQRTPDEFFVKHDDDLTWCSSNWVEEMQEQIERNPKIGILGLRRDDVYGELIPDGELLWNKDIMGTCTMLNPLLIERIGYYCQPSNYGYDDNLLSIRSLVSGFKNAFMRNIKIVNLDKGGTEYTEWKKREAGIYLGEIGIMCDMYRNGTLDVYYDGGF